MALVVSESASKSIGKGQPVSGPASSPITPSYIDDPRAQQYIATGEKQPLAGAAEPYWDPFTGTYYDPKSGLYAYGHDSTGWEWVTEQELARRRAGPTQWEVLEPQDQARLDATQTAKTTGEYRNLPSSAATPWFVDPVTPTTVWDSSTQSWYDTVSGQHLNSDGTPFNPEPDWRTAPRYNANPVFFGEDPANQKNLGKDGAPGDFLPFVAPSTLNPAMAGSLPLLPEGYVRDILKEQRVQAINQANAQYGAMAQEFELAGMDPAGYQTPPPEQDGGWLGTLMDVGSRVRTAIDDTVNTAFPNANIFGLAGDLVDIGLGNDVDPFGLTSTRSRLPEDWTAPLPDWAEESVRFSTSPLGAATNLIPVTRIGSVPGRIAFNAAQDLAFGAIMEGAQQAGLPAPAAYGLAFAGSVGGEAALGRGLARLTAREAADIPAEVLDPVGTRIATNLAERGTPLVPVSTLRAANGNFAPAPQDVVTTTSGLTGAVTGTNLKGQVVLQSAGKSVAVSPDEIASIAKAPDKELREIIATWTPDEIASAPALRQEVLVPTPDGPIVAIADEVKADGTVLATAADGAKVEARVEQAIPITGVRKGDKVVVASLGKEGTVITARGNSLQVRVGNETVTVPKTDAVKLTTERKPLRERLGVEEPTEAPTPTPVRPRVPEAEQAGMRYVEEDISTIRDGFAALRSILPESEVDDLVRSAEYWTPAQVDRVAQIVNRHAGDLPEGLQEQVAAILPKMKPLEVKSLPSSYRPVATTTGPLQGGDIVWIPTTREFARVKGNVMGNKDSTVFLESLDGSGTIPFKRRDQLHPVQLNGKQVNVPMDNPRAIDALDMAAPEPLNMRTVRTRANDALANVNRILERDPTNARALARKAELEKSAGPYTGPEPGLENALRNDPIARGKDHILSRIDMEVRLGRLTPEEAQVANGFIRALPSHYLDKVGISFLRGDSIGGSAVPGGQVVGQYMPIESLVRIARDSGQAGRATIHEMFHHIENFVPDVDRAAMLRQWTREMGTGQDAASILPGGGTGGDLIVRVQPTIQRMMEKGDLEGSLKSAVGQQRDEILNSLTDEQRALLSWNATNEELALIDDAYRYLGGFREWFAEVMTDKVLRDQLVTRAPGTRHFVQEIGYHLRNLMEGLYNYLLRRGEKDAAERVYQQIQKGKYREFRLLDTENADLRVLGGRNVVNFKTKVAPPAGWFRGRMFDVPQADSFRSVKSALNEGARVFERERNAWLNVLHTSSDAAIKKVGPYTRERITVNLVDANGNPYKGTVQAYVFKEVAPTSAERALGLSHPTLGSIVENPTAYTLTARQREGIDEIRSMIDMVVAEGRSFGYDVNATTLIDDITTGGYFPRRPVTVRGAEPRGSLKRTIDEFRDVRPPAEEVGPTGVGGRKLATTAFSERQAANELEGMAKGASYDDPLATLDAYFSKVTRNIEATYVTHAVKPFGVANSAPGYRHVSSDLAPALAGNRYRRGPSFTTKNNPVAARVRPGDAERIERFYNKLEGKKLDGPAGAVIDAVQAFNNAVIPIRLTMDSSAMAIQQAPNAVLHPGIFWPGVWRTWNPRQGFMFSDAKWNQYANMSNPKFERAARAGVAITGEAGERPEFAFSKWPEHLPSVAGSTFRGFNRNFNRFNTLMRVEMFNAQFEAAQRAGKTMDGMAADQAAKFINRWTGVSTSPASDIEAMALLAPRYFRSGLETLWHAAKLTGGAESRLAQNHLLTYAAFGMTGVAAAAMYQGRDLREVLQPVTVEDGELRWNSNFGTIRVQGSDVNVFGQYRALMRIAALFMEGARQAATDRDLDGILSAVEYFMRSKGGPATQILWDVIDGENFIDEPISFSAAQAIDWFAPITVSNIYETWKSGVPLNEAVAAGLLAFIGASATPLSPWEIYNGKFKDDPSLDQYRIRGKDNSYSNLNEFGQAEVVAKYGPIPETRNKDILRSIKEREEKDAMVRAAQDALSAAILSGADPKIIDQKYKELRTANHLLNEWLYRNYKGNPDDPLTQYFDFVDSVTTPEGTNWEMVDDYVAGLDSVTRAQLQAYLTRKKTERQSEASDYEAARYQIIDGLSEAGFYEMRDAAWADFAKSNGLTEKSFNEWIANERDRLFKAASGGGEIMDALRLQAQIDRDIEDSDIFKGWVAVWGGTKGTGVKDEFFLAHPELHKVMAAADAIGLLTLEDAQVKIANAEGKTRDELLAEYQVAADQNIFREAVKRTVATHGRSQESIQAIAFEEAGITGWESMGEIELSYKEAKAQQLGFVTAEQLANVSSITELEALLGKQKMGVVNDEWGFRKNAVKTEEINGITFPGLRPVSDRVDGYALQNAYTVAHMMGADAVVRGLKDGSLTPSIIGKDGDLKEGSFVELGRFLIEAYGLNPADYGVPDPAKTGAAEVKAWFFKLMDTLAAK